MPAAFIIPRRVRIETFVYIRSIAYLQVYAMYIIAEVEADKNSDKSYKNSLENLTSFHHRNRPVFVKMSALVGRLYRKQMSIISRCVWFSWNKRKFTTLSKPMQFWLLCNNYAVCRIRRPAISSCVE